MNTTSHAKLLDRKEKARKGSLQWLFSDTANDVRVHNISDKREMGVCTTNDKTAANKPGGKDHYKGDSLPGLLTLDLFTGGLLSLSFNGVHVAPLADIAEMADTVWLDRRKPAAPAQPEMTYFPY